MKILLVLIFILLVVLVVVWLGSLVVSYFSGDRRSERESNKSRAQEIVETRRQLHTARANLIKIAANDSGNPSLEAQLALEELSRMENKESE